MRTVVRSRHLNSDTMKSSEGTWMGYSLLALLNLHLLRYSAMVTAARTCNFPAIFNFGDSTSDTGGIQAAFPTFSQSEFPPYGMTFPGKPALRAGEALELPYLSAYLQAVGSDFRHGVNFATAGATAQAVTFISPFSLNVQLNQFNEFRQRVLSHQGGRYLPSDDVFSKALYIVEIGGNDFSYGYTRNLNFDQVKNYLPRVVDAIGSLVKGIYQAGGRTILVFDAGPQGCVPYFLTNFPAMAVELDAVGCAIEYNDVTRYYNSLLKTGMSQLQSQLPDSSIIYIDSFAIKYALTVNAKQNGFLYTTKACCGMGGRYNYDYNQQCGRSKTQIGNFDSIAPACSNPSQYLNWDGVHYTEAANRYIARKILTEQFFEPAFPLNQLCQLKPI
ncbi:hypothetical protein O6H91_Y273900 [Diphasiastrum complanatum]|nr:hypothetical protein O6H91_Y273900 [Diphasiastrum complanatum]